MLGKNRRSAPPKDVLERVEMPSGPDGLMLEKLTITYSGGTTQARSVDLQAALCKGTIIMGRTSVQVLTGEPTAKETELVQLLSRVGKLSAELFIEFTDKAYELEKKHSVPERPDGDTSKAIR